MPFTKIGLGILQAKKVILYVLFSHNCEKIKVDCYDYLPLEKKLTLHNVIIRIKSVFNKDQNHYYYNIFLEKCSYQLAKINGKFFFLIL